MDSAPRRFVEAVTERHNRDGLAVDSVIDARFRNLLTSMTPGEMTVFAGSAVGICAYIVSEWEAEVGGERLTRVAAAVARADELAGHEL